MNQEHVNESIYSEEILEDLKKNRIDHMTYLPGMEQLESDMMDRVLSAAENYNYDSYSEKDVRRALAKENRGPEDFAALLAPAALPLLEDIAQEARRETRKHFGLSLIHIYSGLIRHCDNTVLYGQISQHGKPEIVLRDKVFKPLAVAHGTGHMKGGDVHIIHSGCVHLAVHAEALGQVCDCLLYTSRCV